MTNGDHIAHFMGQTVPDHRHPPDPSVAGGSATAQRREDRSPTDATAGYGEDFRSVATKPRSKRRRPDPSAPNITAPCSECGRRFWSQKALFGHMRCHPERQWRGVNPPPQFRRQEPPPSEVPPSTSTTPPPHPQQGGQVPSRDMDHDHEVAAYLVTLANGPAPEGGAAETSTPPPAPVPENLVNCRYECSSCKKVFGSHQALGGHRASHKSVKGCFAVARGGGEEGNAVKCGGDDGAMAGEAAVATCPGCGCTPCSGGGFSGGGQAPPPRRNERWRWERDEEVGDEGAGGLPDLNLPPPVEGHVSYLEAVWVLKLGR